MSPGSSGRPDGGLPPLTRMELAISYVLRGGVLLSAAVILVGILLLTNSLAFLSELFNQWFLG